jgi:hypothetical protein
MTTTYTEAADEPKLHADPQAARRTALKTMSRRIMQVVVPAALGIAGASLALPPASASVFVPTTGIDVQPIPEPTTMEILAGSVLALGCVRVATPRGKRSA